VRRKNSYVTCVFRSRQTDRLIRLCSSFFHPLTHLLISPTLTPCAVTGASYRTSFWAAMRVDTPVNYLPPYAFTVALDGSTVYNTVPSSSAWTLVITPSATAVAATSTKITLSIATSSPTGDTGDRTMAVAGVTLVGAVSYVSQADAAASMNRVSETRETAATARFAKTKVVNFGWSNWEGLTTDTGSVTMTAAFGPWSISTTTAAMRLVYKAFVSPNYIACSCVPYGFSYVLAIYSGATNNAQQSLMRTYGQMVVGGTYSVSFWYARTADASNTPNNFQVTLGGTAVWNTVPTSASWVSHATVLCCVVLYCVVRCVVCCVVLCGAVLRCAALRRFRVVSCGVLCTVVCCGVLCGAVRCCAVLCCVADASIALMVYDFSLRLLSDTLLLLPRYYYAHVVRVPCARLGPGKLCQYHCDVFLDIPPVHHLDDDFSGDHSAVGPLLYQRTDGAACGADAIDDRRCLEQLGRAHHHYRVL
jgi:hypothetical protein